MKPLLSLLFIIVLANLTIAQTTAIPDPNFEQKLIDYGLDNGPIDGSVLTSNIDTVTRLFVHVSSINDLTGIESFIALKFLNCNVNTISTIDLSQNINLEEFYCMYNDIVRLDLSQNPNLHSIRCNDNQLECLNIKNGNNSNFQTMRTKYNSNLTCIEVDDTAYSTNNWPNNTALFYYPTNSFFSTNCSNTCSPVGINEHTFTKLSLYPNPTTGIITVNLGELKKNMKATLTNSLGQLILTQQFESTNIINIDIDAPAGIYFLQLESNGEVLTKKIVKE